MTLFVETVDFIPATIPVYGSDPDGHPVVIGATLAEAWDVPDAMAAAILALVTGPEGEGRCAMPGCDNTVGWYLDDSDDDRPRAGWRFTAVVWDDTEVQTHAATREDPADFGPLPALTLCEDHAPEDPYRVIEDMQDAEIAAALAGQEAPQ